MPPKFLDLKGSKVGEMMANQKKNSLELHPLASKLRSLCCQNRIVISQAANPRGFVGWGGVGGPGGRGGFLK